MLGFAPVAHRSICAGRAYRITGTLTVIGTGGADTLALTTRITSPVVTGIALASSSASTSRFSSASVVGVPVAAHTGTTLRWTSAEATGGPGADMVVIAIRLANLVGTGRGLTFNTGLPIWLGRPGTASPAWGLEHEQQGDANDDLVGAERAPLGRDLGLQRPWAGGQSSYSRPAAESLVPASRAPSASTNRESSRRATGAAASTQRSASTTGPALRSADDSSDPGRQR